MTAKIDLDALKLDRDQLWAEALHVYSKNDFNLFITDKEIEKYAEKAIEERAPIDPWEDIISEWLEKELQNDEHRVIKRQEIFESALEGVIRTLGAAESRRIANIMRKLGWEKGSYYSKKDSKSINGYRKKIKSEV